MKHRRNRNVALLLLVAITPGPAAPALLAFIDSSPPPPQRAFANRVQALKTAVAAKTAREGFEAGDLAHAVTGYGDDPRVMARLRRSVVRAPGRRDAAAALSQAVHGAEDHLGETIDALTKVLGASRVVQGPAGAVRIAELVQSEKTGQRLANVLMYIRDGLEGDVRQIRERAAALESRWPEITRAEARSLRDLQAKINGAELSWMQQAIIRELEVRGHDLDEQWIDAAGQAASARTISDANLKIYEHAVSVPQIQLMTERGAHALQALGTLLRFCEAREGGCGLPQVYWAAYERLTQDLIMAGATLDGANVRRRAPVEYVIAVHILEFLYDPSYYKPSDLEVAGKDFAPPLDRVEAIVVSSLTLVEERVKMKDRLGFAFAMHTRRALELIAGVS